MIRVAIVLDPFRPGTQRIYKEVECVSVMTLDAVLRSAGADPDKSIAVIDGKGIPPELAAGYMVDDGIDIVVMPYVGGSGWGRVAAELAVVIAASVVTFGLASAGALGVFAAGIGLGNLSAGAVGLIGSAIALGGNLLISAFMSPSASGGLDSATYDPTGPKTVASGGIPIPKGYGKMRWGGNIIASYIDAEGQDNYMNVLVSFGWGPATSISDVRINNTPIYDYVDAIYQVRLGTNDQTPIPYFNRIVNGYPQATRCNAGAAVTVTGTGTATQGLEVVIQFPNGVFWSADNGSLRSLSIAYKIEYSVSGTGTWKTPNIPRTTTDVPRFLSGGVMTAPGWIVVPTDNAFSSGLVYAYDNSLSPTAHTPGDSWSGTSTVTYYNADGSTSTGSIFLQGEWQPYDPNLGQQVVTDWSNGYIIFTDANQGTLYHTTKIYNLPANKYDVRVTKYGSAFAGDPINFLEANNARTGDQVWIHAINEVQYQDLAYPNEILLGVRALATNQLSGNGVNITALVEHGITTTLPSELSSYGTDNPAVVAYDMMCADGALYGGGVTLDSSAIADLAQWAAYNDETVSDGGTGTIKRHVFNGVFEEQNASLWKCLQKLCTMANCIPAQIGKNYSFTVDGPVTVPVQVFTVGNTKRDSLKDTWMSLDDRSNRVEVTFADEARDYRTDEPCAVMTPDDIQAGVEVKTTRVSLLGCTNRAQAWHWAYRKLRDTKSIILTRSFDTNIEAVACQIGSIIGVQDDVTQWSDGGRIQAGSTATALIVDRSDLTFAPSAGWTVSILHPSLLRGTATVDTVVGNLLTFTAAVPAGRLLRCVRSSGLEATIESTGTNTALLDNAAGFAHGDVVSLYDQDVIDTQVVSSYSGFTLVPVSPFLATPSTDSQWVYGQSAGAFPAPMFRVTNLKRKGDFDITIDCVNYDPSVYADDTPIIEETLGVPDVNAAVTGLVLSENYTLANVANGGQMSSIQVGWQNGPNTSKVEVWIATQDAHQPLSRETLLATVSKGTTYSFPAPTGQVVQIRAVGVDAAGITASWSAAPVATITVQGSGTAPGDVTGFVGNYQAGTTTLTWTAPTGAASYQIRYNADPANTDWEASSLLWAGTGTTWADTTDRPGVYLIKAISSATVESVNAASFNLTQSTSYLNAVGLADSQAIVVSVSANAYVTGALPHNSIQFSWSAQTLYRTDGTTVTLPAGTLGIGSPTYPLVPLTTFYIYLMIRLSDMTIHSAIGDPTMPIGWPYVFSAMDTSPNPATAVIQGSDGYAAGPIMIVTTCDSTSSGGSSSGGTYICPEANELVKVGGRGLIRAGDVREGDYLLGLDIESGREVWRAVLASRLEPSSTWYVVRGFCVSPVDQVRVDGEWRYPYEIGKLDTREGHRAGITVEGETYDDHNYFLYSADGGDRLLMHNRPVYPC
jgi:sulfur carrier protein ThiS